jgi:hypothetical protein
VLVTVITLVHSLTVKSPDPAGSARISRCGFELSIDLTENRGNNKWIGGAC